MDIIREELFKELKALKEAYPATVWNPKHRVILIRQFPFPSGWRPQTGSILYELPPTYRQEQPEAYMPACMSYKGSTPHIMLNTRTPPPGFDDDKWAGICIHRMKNWHPDRHTTITMTRLIKKSLKYPNVADPWNA